MSGPKPVSPRVITQRDISWAAVELLEPSDRSSEGFAPDVFFQNCLAKGAAGPTLFVLDNFETKASIPPLYPPRPPAIRSPPADFGESYQLFRF